MIVANNYRAGAVNRGARLWWQQYYGLLMKRTLDTVRHWQIFAAIYALPVLACLVGLLLFRFLNLMPSDPSRTLQIDNSGLDPSNQILFWAKISNFSDIFDFEVSVDIHIYSLSVLASFDQKFQFTCTCTL